MQPRPRLREGSSRAQAAAGKTRGLVSPFYSDPQATAIVSVRRRPPAVQNAPRAALQSSASRAPRRSAASATSATTTVSRKSLTLLIGAGLLIRSFAALRESGRAHV